MSNAIWEHSRSEAPVSDQSISGTICVCTYYSAFHSLLIPHRLSLVPNLTSFTHPRTGTGSCSYTFRPPSCSLIKASKPTKARQIKTISRSTRSLRPITAHRHLLRSPGTTTLNYQPSTGQSNYLLPAKPKLLHLASPRFPNYLNSTSPSSSHSSSPLLLFFFFLLQPKALH